MAKEKKRPWLVLLLVVILLLFIVVGGYGLSKDATSIYAYALLGLGLGGLIAGFGALTGKDKELP